MLFPIRDFRRSESVPILTYMLIAVNVAVFIYQHWLLGDAQSAYFLFKYSVTPCEIFSTCSATPLSDFPSVLTLGTSIFLHGDLFHLIGNMWFLWVFGDNVEDALGKPGFLLFYFIGGLVASLAQILINPASPIPMVGASGAIAAVLGGYLVLYPTARVLSAFFLVFIWPVTLPAVFLLGYWFLIQVFSSFVGSGSQIGGGVAYMAHIGGFIAGALLVRVFARRRRQYEWES